MESTSPVLAADVVNQLLREYQAVTIEEKNLVTLQKLQFIDTRIDSVELELDSIENQYVSFRQQNNVISPTAQATNYLIRVEEADKALREQRVQIATVNQIEDYLRNRGTADFAVPSSLSIQDPTLGGLVGEFNKAQQERNELLANAPEKI